MSLIHHEAWFQRDRRLIWNTDEIQLKLLKRFRLFRENGTMPLMTAMRQFRYIRGMIWVSADAVALKPIAILKILELWGNFSDLESHCVFAASMNWWITNKLWTYWALVFLASISEYRFSLPLKWEIVTCYWLSMVTRVSAILSLHWFFERHWRDLAFGAFMSLITNIRRGSCNAIEKGVHIRTRSKNILVHRC
jgi:hypothetical protein